MSLSALGITLDLRQLWGLNDIMELGYSIMILVKISIYIYHHHYPHLDFVALKWWLLCCAWRISFIPCPSPSLFCITGGGQTAFSGLWSNCFWLDLANRRHWWEIGGRESPGYCSPSLSCVAVAVFPWWLLFLGDTFHQMTVVPRL